MLLLDLVEHFVEAESVSRIRDKEVWVRPLDVYQLNAPDQVLDSLELKAVNAIRILCFLISIGRDLEQKEGVAA